MSSGIYRVGQKVTPVDGAGWHCDDPAAPRFVGPQHGRAYTVAAFADHADGTPAIVLREYPSDFRFAKRDFRPLVDESRRYSVSWTCPLPQEEAQEHYNRIMSEQVRT